MVCGSSTLINYKKLTRKIGLELSGHQPSILLTLVLFPRIEVAATVKNEGFLGELIPDTTLFAGFKKNALTEPALQ